MMKDFCGFRWGQIHSSDLNLVVVSSSDRYTKNLLPEIQDVSTEISGGDGQYYFGSTFTTRTFEVDVAFNKVDERGWRRIANFFATDKLQDLVFDELPYKTYKAKLSTKPEFTYICFTDRDTNQRVYKGEGKLTFICYYPYAFGFNKYIIRAADQYLEEKPTSIPYYFDINENPYEKEKQIIYNNTTKDFYNVEKNMNTPWKGGYPTLEQAQAGELFFKNPDGELEIIDVRNYFKNVPEWAESSKLLVTPTLDYDQDLMYMPQYSKTNYYNMDTGLNQENALIGSRLLVYNPGDIPIDFELKMENVEKTFHSPRGKTFRVRRFNVERLSIPQAVDWTGMKVENRVENLQETFSDGTIYNYFEIVDDDEKYKYGTHYFRITQYPDDNETNLTTSTLGTGDFYYSGYTKEKIQLRVPSDNEDLLGNKHPSHAFIVEPIPRHKLGDFIRMFYWQSSLLKDTSGNPILDYEEGIKLADRYEELYRLCIDDDERFELYWKTLKEAILYQYKDSAVFDSNGKDAQGETIEDFIYSYINEPPEFIRRDDELFYGQYKFNKTIMPIWFTEDYFDITTDEIDDNTLFLDTDKRMLYNIVNPEYNKDDENTWDNFYNYKPSKEILNDNIKRGHWFKVPPGWSMIEVCPVVDEDNWGGKRWLDARPFDWGYGGEKVEGNHCKLQQLFDIVYSTAKYNYLALVNYSLKNSLGLSDADFNKSSYKKTKLDIRLWFEPYYLDYDNNYEKVSDNFTYEYYKTKEINAELRFLRYLHRFWHLQKGISSTIFEEQNSEGNGLTEVDYTIKGTIEEWWWYACNYEWQNFPPLYWGFADILNNARIKYTPLFY